MLDKLLKFLKVHFVSQLVLKDGTALQLEGDLETGVGISIITPDGNIALPDGTYQMEDMTIITVENGLVVDIIEPGTIEKDTEGLDPMGNPVPADLVQNGNPDITGEEPVVTEDPNLLTGTTVATEPVVDPEMAEIPVEDAPEVEVEVDEEALKIAELEAKIAAMEQMMNDMMAKMNMISEKFSAASPIVRRKEDNSTIDPRLQNKVDLIRSLKKS